MLALVVPFISATPSIAKQAAPPVFPVGEPIAATVNGRAVALTLSTGALDRPILATSVAEALKLRPEPNSPSILVGGVPSLPMRRAYGKLGLFGTAQRTTLAWFPESSAAAVGDGTIGPAWLPFRQVVIGLPGREGVQWEWPLGYSRASASYAVVPIAGNFASVLFGVERDLRYPLASAAMGNLLQRNNGGRIVPESWDEEMIPGARRPVRLLVLDKPLMIGPWRFHRIAVNVRTGDDKLSSARGPHQAVKSSNDPDEIAVEARSPDGPAPSYTLIIPSRWVLQCAKLSYAKAEQRLRLNCAENVEGS
jgi:hypothetical protein